jgi:hypothetical protein
MLDIRTPDGRRGHAGAGHETVETSQAPAPTLLAALPAPV